MVEVIGYIASAIVLVSFLMKDVRKLRTINTIGCLTFAIYGVLLDWSIPIIATNTIIAGINIVFLIRTKKNKI